MESTAGVGTTFFIDLAAPAFFDPMFENPPGLLGLPSDISLPARMVVLAFVASLAMFPLNPLSAWRSRCQEREAGQVGSRNGGVSGHFQCLGLHWHRGRGIHAHSDIDLQTS